MCGVCPIKPTQHFGLIMQTISIEIHGKGTLNWVKTQHFDLPVLIRAGHPIYLQSNPGKAASDSWEESVIRLPEIDTTLEILGVDVM